MAKMKTHRASAKRDVYKRQIYLYTKRISSAITVHILVNIFIIIMRFF